MSYIEKKILPSNIVLLHFKFELDGQFIFGTLGFNPSSDFYSLDIVEPTLSTLSITRQQAFTLFNHQSIDDSFIDLIITLCPALPEQGGAILSKVV